MKFGQTYDQWKLSSPDYDESETYYSMYDGFESDSEDNIQMFEEELEELMRKYNIKHKG